MDLRLTNAATVVVGGSRCMGLATARCLAEAVLPEKIGPVAAFLASPRNSLMTGANIKVDGGSDFT